MNKRLSRKKLQALRQRKLLGVIIGCIVTGLITGGVALAYYQKQTTPNQTKPAATTKSPKATPSQTAKSSPASNQSPSPSPASSTVPSPSPTASSSKKPVAQTYSPYPTPDISPKYYLSAIHSAYLTCNYGILWYTVGSIDIYTIGPAAHTFTWRIEISDGTVSYSGTDTLSENGTWLGFPNTPSYPQPLGYATGAEDGDRIRFVITSPIYTASAWTKAVPGGSQQACQSGQMTSSVPL